MTIALVHHYRLVTVSSSARMNGNASIAARRPSDLDFGKRIRAESEEYRRHDAEYREIRDQREVRNADKRTSKRVDTI